MLKTGQAPVSILRLTPCSISMLWAEKGLCATETILLAEFLLLWKAWTSRSSGWGSWKSVWHSLTATATHLGVSRALPAMPGATGSATSLTRAGSVCLALLRHIPPASRTSTETLCSCQAQLHRQCQLQSVGSCVNVSMNSVEDHMLRVWPWERPVYLTHGPWSAISVPLIANRLFHILLQHSALSYLNENQNKMLWRLKMVHKSDTKISALINWSLTWTRISNVIKHYKFIIVCTTTLLWQAL